MPKRIISWVLLLTIFIIFQSSNATYNVVNFGAKPDGKTDSTRSFYRAWSSACNSTEPAKIYVPRGIFLIKPITFRGPCKNKITFHINGTIVAPSNYRDLGNSGHWISFFGVNRVSVYGGTIDARGAGYWACRKTEKKCPIGARSLSFLASSNVVISGLTSINSQIMHIALDQCDNVVVQHVNISAPSWSPNTDGIHSQSSTGVTIRNSTITTGDDCISIGPASKNLSIQGIACGPGHGISIGSLGNNVTEDGVQDVKVSEVVFSGTENGVRIKTWARPSNGFARNIVFQNIVMKYVYNPIIIDQYYCPDHNNCPHQSSGIKISGVTYKNIKGTSAKQAAVKFACSSSNPCKGIELQNINLTYYKTATSYCKYASGRSTGVVVPKSCLV